MDDKQSSELQNLASNSLDVISLTIALTFKWEKKEYIEKINVLMKEIAESMTQTEKDEFTQRAIELGLIEQK